MLKVRTGFVIFQAKKWKTAFKLICSTVAFQKL